MKQALLKPLNLRLSLLKERKADSTPCSAGAGGSPQGLGVISAAKRDSGQAEMQAAISGHIHSSLEISAVCFGVEFEGRRSQQSPAPSLYGVNSQRWLEMQNSY